MRQDIFRGSFPLPVFQYLYSFRVRSISLLDRLSLNSPHIAHSVVEAVRSRSPIPEAECPPSARLETGGAKV
jgi:hypothetical protein